MRKVLIIGYGNFGKLLAKLLINFTEVYIYDKKNIDLNIEERKKITVLNNKEMVGKMDYIVFCVPVQFLQKSILEFKKHITPETIVLDVTSVKIIPLQLLQKYFPQNQIIGTHPLFGPESIAKKVSDLKVVLTDVSALPSTKRAIIDSIEKMGFTVLEMTAEKHDKQIAKVQALSHYIGFALRDFDLREKVELRTLAYRKMYALYENVLNDSDDLFKTIQNYNPYAEKIRKLFVEHLIKLNEKLKTEK